MNFFRKWAWLFMGVAAVAILTFGFDFARSYFQARAFAAASAKYEEKLRAADAKVTAGKAQYAALSEKAGKDREDQRLAAEEALRKAAFNFEKFKSRSAEELQAKKATIVEVLAEKKKDELAIDEAKKSINYLGTLCFMILKAWGISDENTDQTHAEVVIALEEKFSTCERWRKTIEKKLRPSFWKTAKEAGKFALAFAAGYGAGRI
jgi:hypothetical protein